MLSTEQQLAIRLWQLEQVLDWLAHHGGDHPAEAERARKIWLNIVGLSLRSEA